jgi:hypothetical protein
MTALFDASNESSIIGMETQSSILRVHSGDGVHKIHLPVNLCLFKSTLFFLA